MSKNRQRLYWAVSRPLRYLGLTLDEWGITLIGVLPGIIFINSSNIKLGLIFLVGGALLCWLFKKYKKISQSFKLKSFLVAKGLVRPPKLYPALLKKWRVGR